MYQALPLEVGLISRTYIDDREPTVDADWLNDLDRLHYDILGNPQTLQEAKDALGVGAPASTTLSALAQLDGSLAADKMPYFIGAFSAGITDLTLVARQFLAATSASAQRIQMGLGSIATQSAGFVNITGGDIVGITDLAIADGGTGASNALNARANLGLEIGLNVQAWDAELQALAGTTSAADTIPYYTNIGVANTTPFTVFARTILDDPDAPTVRSTLGLGTLSTQNANTVSITGGSIIGITDLAVADGGTGSSTAAGARTNLGLQIGVDVQQFDTELQAIAALVSAADRLPYFTGSGTAALAVFTAAGRALVDDVDAAAQRTTLGLGTIATQNANNVTITGGSISGLTPDLAVADGGTGASTAATARTNLGAAASGAVASSGLTMNTARLLGRTTAAVGDIEEIAVGAGLSLSGLSLTNTGVTSVAATQPSTGLTITGSPITTTGTLVFALANDLLALENLASTGFAVRTAADTWAQRTLTTTAGQLSITNGNGVSGNPLLDLANVGSAIADGFVRITTDAKGRVTASNPVSNANITTALGFTPVNKAGDTMTGDLLLNTSAPSAALQAASKQYVDNVAIGLSPKASCRVATTANITLSGLQTIDGVTLVADNRVLVKNQTNQAQNGIYVAKVGAWVRGAETDTAAELNDAFCFIREGTLFADTGWTQIATVVTLETDPVIWTQFSGAGTVTEGTGISVVGQQVSLAVGNTLSLFNLGVNGLVARTAANTVTARTIQAGSSKISITNGGGVAGDPSIDAVEANFTLTNIGGTLTVLKGGTGATTAAGARTNLGLVIGTDVQAQDPELQAIAGLVSAADRVPYYTGSGTAALAVFTAAGRALVDDADAAAQRTTLGLGSIATQAANAVAITGGSITGITDLAVADGGTGASTAADARTNLGLVIGTNVQAQDAELQAIADLVSAADRLPYYTGLGTAALATFTAAGRALVDDADAASQRTTLGLGTIATQAASAVSITGGTITGITDLAVADGGTGASTAATARTNLGAAASGAVGGSGLTMNTARLLGRTTAAAGAIEEISVGPGLSLSAGSIDAVNNGTVTSVAATAPAAGFTITGSPITASGTLTFALANDLLALENLAVTGMAARTAADTWTTRTIQGTAGNITVTNGSGVAGDPTINLPNVGTAVTAQLRRITTDAQGRVSATAAPIQSDITTALGFTPVNRAGDTMTGALTLSADPTAALHSATKQYVDNVATGLDPKASCRVATTANITLSGLQTIDGVTLVANNRVLVKNQTTTSQNGIYLAASGAWSRSLDADTADELNDAFVFIREGTVNTNTGWVVTSDIVTLGTDPVTWAQFSGPGTVTAGTGISVVGQQVALATSNVLSLFNLGTNGIVARTAVNTVTARTITAGAHIGVTNGDGVAGNPTIAINDAELTSIANLVSAADRLPYYTGAGTAALAVFTAAGRALVDDADATAQRTTLGLGTIATQNANAVALTGGTITGITDLAVADGGTGASTAAAARTNLAAMQDVFTTRGDLVRRGVSAEERIALGVKNSVFTSDGVDAIWTNPLRQFRYNIIDNGLMSHGLGGVTGIERIRGVTTMHRWRLEGYSTAVTIDASATTTVPALASNASGGNALTLTASLGGAMAAADHVRLSQRINLADMRELRWGTASAVPATLSFWIRATVTGTYTVGIGHSTRWYSTTFTISVTNTWEYKTVTFAADTGGTHVRNDISQNPGAGSGTGLLYFYFGAGTNNQSASMNVWNTGSGIPLASTSQVNAFATTTNIVWLKDVQMEAGSNVSDLYIPDHIEELNRCLAWTYPLRTNFTGGGNKRIATGTIITSSTAQFNIRHPVTQRDSQPWMLINNQAMFGVQRVDEAVVATTLATQQASNPHDTYINVQVAGTPWGAVLGHSCRLFLVTSAAADQCWIGSG